jgi:YVTN family beta-propeller protein
MKRLSALFLSTIWIFLIWAPQLYSETTAYFPNYGDDNVYRVFANDEANFTPVSVNGCEGPYGAAVTPDGSSLLITCTDSNNVIMVPTANFVSTTAQDIISLVDKLEPRGVAVESRGMFAYVANFASDNVSQINISSGLEIDTFDVGEGPWGVAATYDSADATPKVYVTNYEEDTVSVISDGGVETIENVGDGPLGAALTPDGEFLYVTNFNDSNVTVIDTVNQSIVTRITVGNRPWGVAMANDGSHVFVTNSNDDTVSLITADSRTVSLTRSVGDHPMGVAAPINADFAYVVNQGDNTISRISTTGTVTLIEEGEFNGAFSLGRFIGGSAPAAPDELEAATESSGSITLSWADNADDELGYRIERREDSEEEEFVQVATTDEDETTYKDISLSRGTTYEYRLRAFNEVGFSDYSTTASATTDNERFSWCFIHALLDRKN